MSATVQVSPRRGDPTSQRRTTDAERHRHLQRQTGSWAPFTDTSPVRAHLHDLRAAGMTQEQIAAAASVSVATLTRATKAARMSTAAADAVRSVRSVPPGDNSTTATAGATESLQELVADGWTVEQLARAAGLSDRTVSRVLHGHATPAPRTAAAIASAYEDLRWEDPGDSTAAVRSRLRAQRAGWRPCTLHDDDLADVDPVAVDRAVAGDVVPLTPVEQQLALSRLAGHHPDREIGRRLGVSSRTVLRHRTSQGLSAYATNRPAEAPIR